MRVILAVVWSCCLLSLTFAQFPGFGGLSQEGTPQGRLPQGGLASLLPLLNRGGVGGEGLLGYHLMSLLSQGGGSGTAGSSALMPLLMLLRGASPAEIMPLLMLTQGGAGSAGGAGGITSNQMLLMSLLQGGDQAARILPLLLMNQQAPSGASSTQPARNVAPLLLPGAVTA